MFSQPTLDLGQSHRVHEARRLPWHRGDRHRHQRAWKDVTTVGTPRVHMPKIDHPPEPSSMSTCVPPPLYTLVKTKGQGSGGAAHEGVSGCDGLAWVPTGKLLFRYSRSRHHPSTRGRGQIGARSGGRPKLCASPPPLALAKLDGVKTLECERRLDSV